MHPFPKPYKVLYSEGPLNSNLHTPVYTVAQMDAYAHAERTRLHALLRQAQEALENSVGLMEQEYVTSWMHNVPTREKQLSGRKAEVDAHKAAIAAITEELR